MSLADAGLAALSPVREDEMWDYCGCQDLSSIDETTIEHNLVVGLISDMRAARAEGDTLRMADLARKIAAVLYPHTEVDEKGLLPALATGTSGQMARLAAEHRRIDAVLDEASAGTPDDATWPDRLIKTLGVLRQHIFREQNGVISAALASPHARDREAVEAAQRPAQTHTAQREIGMLSDARS
jgi:hemerythrin HHE cation binding domain-containing protein